LIAFRSMRFLRWTLLGFLLYSNVALASTNLVVPNYSFETPLTLFVNTHVDEWSKIPKPDYYVESGGYTWDQLAGTFLNDPPSQADHIDNCDGNQAIYMFADPLVTLFKDYESGDWSHTNALHDFPAIYESNKSYRLTVGVIGSGGGMQSGVGLQLSLYYLDDATNRIPVAVNDLVYNSQQFPNNTHFVDCSVDVPPVRPGDPWAGKHIGIKIVSTATLDNQGGYWDLDNVRLVATTQAILLNPAITNGNFAFTLRGDAGSAYAIQVASAVTNPSPTNWSTAFTLTNTTGDFRVVDPSTNSGVRFYRAQRLF
jgi:hypothetical protein